MIFFGLLWGMLEATVEEALRLTHFTFKGALLANIGFFLMAALKPMALPSCSLGALPLLIAVFWTVAAGVGAAGGG